MKHCEATEPSNPVLQMLAWYKPLQKSHHFNVLIEMLNAKFTSLKSGLIIQYLSKIIPVCSLFHSAPVLEWVLVFPKFSVQSPDSYWDLSIYSPSNIYRLRETKTREKSRYKYAETSQKRVESNDQNIPFKYIYLLWRQNNLYSYKNYKTCNRNKKKKKYKPLKMYRIQNGMSYLAIISKTGSEMITKIQHQTAPWQSVVLLLQPKIIKPTDRRWKYQLCMNTESYWSKVSQRIEDYMCLHGTGLCVSSQLSSCPQLGRGVCCFVFFLLLSGRMKASPFQHNGGVVVHVKDGKICLTKEECKFSKKTRVECQCWQ